MALANHYQRRLALAIWPWTYKIMSLKPTHQEEKNNMKRKPRSMLFVGLLILMINVVLASPVFSATGRGNANADSNSITFISMDDAQLKYCPPVVGPLGQATISLIKIEVNVLQEVYITIYLDGKPIHNNSIEIHSSPSLYSLYEHLDTINIAETNEPGIHTLKVEMFDASYVLLASDEKKYEIVSCDGLFLTFGYPSSYCVGNPPDNLPANLNGNGGDAVHANWTTEEGWVSSDIPQGEFNAALYIPSILFFDIFETEGFHFLRCDAPAESSFPDQSKPFLSNTMVFFVRPCELPTITTAEVTDITPTAAVSGGNVTSDGGSPVTARGVCWSTSPNPTTANSKTTDGTGTGSFASSLTGLSPGTPYYVRAYATNGAGTGYGNEVTFTASYSTLYVSKDGICNSLTPCYVTIQEAVNASGNGTVILVTEETYYEGPTKDTPGTIAISGGWKRDFSGQEGATSMYAPSAAGGGGLKVMPSVKIIPKP